MRPVVILALAIFLGGLSGAAQSRRAPLPTVEVYKSPT